MNDIASAVDDSGIELFQGALQRAKADYLEMPGLQLTAAQAMRLWAFDAPLCRAVLSTLVEARFLIQTRRATFARP
jgi:hypothetical protein